MHTPNPQWIFKTMGSISCNIIVPTEQVSLKYLQACMLPRKKVRDDLREGDMVQVQFPDGNTFLCKLSFTWNETDSCGTVSDVVSKNINRPIVSGDHKILLNRVGQEPTEISTLELDVTLNENRIRTLDFYEDPETLIVMVRNLCTMLVIGDGYSIDLTSYPTFNNWAIVRLDNLRTDAGLGTISAKTSISFRSIRLVDGPAPFPRLLGGLADVQATLEMESKSNILLVGPSGCGKTTLIATVASKLDANLLRLKHQVPSFTGDNVLLARAKRIIRLSRISTVPTIVLIEDVEQFCSKPRYAKRGSVDTIHPEILQVLDMLNGAEKVRVIATTRNVEALDSSIRRPGRLDREVYIKVPNEEQRREIVTVLLKEFHKEPEQSMVDKITSRTPAYVGGDLLTLLRKAKQISGDDSITTQGLESAFLTVRPVGVRTNPHLIARDDTFTLSSLGGLQTLKKTIDMAIFQPLRYPERFQSFGLSLPKGILLYGPPGCAKTTVVKCLSTEMNRNFIAISAAHIYSPYVGDSEQLLAQIFYQARICAPSIIFIDEIDSIVGSRTKDQKGRNDVQTKLLSTLLIEMDGIGLTVQSNHNPQNHILVIGATNRPDLIDDALMRPGRFDRLIYVPAPSTDERLDVLSKLTGKMPVGKDVDLRSIAEKTKRYSGADLVNLCSEAALHALTLSRNEIQLTMSNFLVTLEKLKPSLTSSQIQWYEAYAAGHSLGFGLKHSPQNPSSAE